MLISIRLWRDGTAWRYDVTKDDGVRMRATGGAVNREKAAAKALDEVRFMLDQEVADASADRGAATGTPGR